jgi:CRISPR-associated protein Csm4
MKTYRLKLKLQSSFLTPWHADTLFGSLCWAMAMREGEERLRQFLDEYMSNPAFILSDGMPGELLPAPAHLPLAVKCDNYVMAKKLKKVCWLSPATFDAFRKGDANIQVGDNVEAFKSFTTMHSSINRFSGTTGQEGSLFELEECTLDSDEIKADYLSLYLKIRQGFEERILSLFRDLSFSGFGKKKSVGKGCFEIKGDLEPYNNFDDFDGANGFVSLSHFVPARTDPIDGFYKTKVKYGRLGGEYTFCGNPYKKPLLMLTAGSVFRNNGLIKEFYGRMVENISVAKEDVVQYGYAFSVPARIDV